MFTADAFAAGATAIPDPVIPEQGNWMLWDYFTKQDTAEGERTLLKDYDIRSARMHYIHHRPS